MIEKKRFSSSLNEKIKKQFNIRSEKFSISANWIKDKELIQTHLDLAGKPNGEALDLCCGTAQVGGALKDNGWNVKGLDIADNMVKVSHNYFPTIQGEAENLPFKSGCFSLVVCRQSFQFLGIKKVLSEVSRILISNGIFILSLTLPFSDVDRDWLYEIHRTKQPLLLRFYTAPDLIVELRRAGFLIKKTKMLRVRESINHWMDYAPELTPEVREKVISLFQKAPLTYKKLHQVEVIEGEIFEDWNWVVIKTTFNKTQ